VFAARRLSQHGFGVFSLGTTIGWMAAVATDFGLQLHLARAVARHPERAPHLLRTWLMVRVWLAAAAIVIVASVLAAFGRDRQASLAILLLVVVYIVSGLIEFLHYFYRGLSRTDLESTLTLWQRFGTLACAAAVLAWRPDITALAAAMLLPVAATLAYSLRRAFRMADAEQRGPHPAERTNAIETASLAGIVAGHSQSGARALDAREAFRDVVPIGLGLILSSLYFRIDVFLIEFWNGTAAVALYGAVFRIVDALRLFPAAVLAVGLPTLFRATDARPLLSVSAIVTAFSLIVTAVLWLAADALIPLLYGVRYAEAVPAFRILLASLPLMSLNYALTHQLVGWNGHRTWAAICAAAFAFNLALNARLIPTWSIAGAAWATLATEALLTVTCCAALWARSSRPGEGTMTVAVSP
jgi:O-antigen/teichoic acid export membrane protein